MITILNLGTCFTADYMVVFMCLYVCVCVYVGAYVCVCVCLCLCVGCWRGGGGRSNLNQKWIHRFFFIDFAKTLLTNQLPRTTSRVSRNPIAMVQESYYSRKFSKKNFVNTKFVNAKKPTLSCFSIPNH